MRYAALERLSIVANPVTGTTDRLDQLAIEAPIDFGAQPADMALDQVRARIEMKRPNVLQQHCPGDDFAGVAQEIFEQLILLLLEVDVPAGSRHGSFEQVKFQVCDDQSRRRLGDRRTSAKRRYPREKFGAGERLDEIIVGTRVQSLDTVGDAVKGGKEECRSLDTCCTNCLERAQAIEIGDDPVQDEGRIFIARRKKDRVASGDAVIDDMARRAEQARYVVAHLPIIFEQEKFHATGKGRMGVFRKLAIPNLGLRFPQASNA